MAFYIMHKVNIFNFYGVLKMNIQFLRLKAVIKKVGLSRSSIYGGMKEKTFPKSYRIGSRAVAWREDEIQLWMSSKTSASTLSNGGV